MGKQEEIARKQKEIAEHSNLGWWYGTDCRKCCGVYPKLMNAYIHCQDWCYYQCEVCSKRTELSEMPWISEKLWNAGKTYYEDIQLSIFEVDT